MESARSKTTTQPASDGALNYDVIVFVVTAVTGWVDGEYRIDDAVRDWIFSLGMRGPDERPFLVLAGTPDMWRGGMPLTCRMDDFLARYRFDLGVFEAKVGDAWAWPMPHLIRMAKDHYGVTLSEHVLVVGNHCWHHRAADAEGASYIDIAGFTGIL